VKSTGKKFDFVSFQSHALYREKTDCKLVVSIGSVNTLST